MPTTPTRRSELAPLVERTEGLQPGRRAFHALCGLAAVALLAYFQPSWTLAVGLLAATVVVLMTVDLVRLTVPAVNRLFFRVLRPVASPREAEGLASSTWFAVGVLLTVALFPRPIAIAAILVLALADPAASYAGRRWGRKKFGAGTVLGSTVFFCVACAALVPLVGPLTGVVTAMVITVIEPIPWPVDDNLVIPLATGVVLWSLLPLVP